MQGYRILLADDHQPMRKNIAEYLLKQEGIALVREAANGAEALKLMREESFDILVTDIIMPMLDGFALMEEVRRMGAAAPKVIVISALSRDDFVTRAIELGACFYMVKPFDMRHLYARIRDLTENRSSAAQQILEKRQSVSLDERLGSLFLTIGIPAHIKGYQFLRQAVKMVVSQPDLINRITKELYPGIAKHFGTSASKVERAIRHAIEVAWNRGRIETLNTAFGCKVCTPEDKPTNGEFIAMIADKLAVEQRSA